MFGLELLFFVESGGVLASERMNLNVNVKDT